MTLIKVIFGIVWVSAICVIGIVWEINTLVTRAVLVGVAILPPIVLWRRWHDPRQTMSESIQEARK